VSIRKWDFFICHASEDKAAVVEPLAQELVQAGVEVWYDRWTLQIGDSLSGKIDEGLASSDYGIVVLSPSFFQMTWPQRELAGLVQKEVEGRKVILPVWHKVDHAFVASQSPTLADRVAGSTNEGIPSLAARLMEAAGKSPPYPGSEIPILTHPVESASIRIGYQKLSIRSDLHSYALTVVLTLNVPPDQGRLRLRLLWPIQVRLSRLLEIREGGMRKLETGEYRELFVDWEQRVFPGEMITIIGPRVTHELVYEFDHQTWSALEEHPQELLYTVFFEDHTPMAGSLPFRDLNVF